jgi:hypothetical protein
MTLASVIVDGSGFPLGLPISDTIGIPGSRACIRVIPALAVGGGPRRYAPNWGPGDRAVVGIDMSALIPSASGIVTSSLAIGRNTMSYPPSSDFAASPPSVIGRAAYGEISGGFSGIDYALTWTITDTDGNVWNRTGLLLCAALT